MNKICSNCNQSRDIEEFAHDKNAEDGRTYQCCYCNKAKCKLWYQQNKEKARLAADAWRKANPEKVKEMCKRSYQKNRTKIRARANAYSEANRELTNAQKREYVKNNKKKVLASKKAWDQRNIERVRAYRLANEQRRRAKKLSATIGDVKAIKAFYQHVHLDDGIICAYCKAIIPSDKRNVDHIIPLSRGGAHSLENLAPACQSCNIQKNNRTPEEYMQFLSENCR